MLAVSDIIVAMEKTIAEIIFQLYSERIEPELTIPDAKFGDLATNVSMQLAARLKKNPREIALEIANEIAQNTDVSEASVAGPGFINIRLSDQALIAQIDCEPPKSRVGKTIVIETNNPNPFKAMHIGHAMNAIVADTLANLLASDGAQVNRVSYHGDVGLHVGKSMYSLLRYADGDIAKIQAVPEAERNSFMSKMYADGSKAYKDDEGARGAIDDLARQSFTPESVLYKDIYELCKAWSFADIDRTVARLGNQPTVARFLESAADQRGVAIVKANTPAVFREANGAYIFEGSKYGSFDNVFISSQGRGLYAARDLGLMELKNEQFHPDESYIVTGNEQAAYFRGVIAAAELVDNSVKGQTRNIPTGLVKLSTGKMSSRDGDVVQISWLFEQFATAIRERGGEARDEIIVGALRYQFLKAKIGSDIVFDISEAVSLTGNTGSYLQYAYARAQHILAKATDNGALGSVDPEDRLLVRKLGEYSTITALAMARLEPHHICNYLFELAQEFNRYYEQNQVIGSDREAHRLALVARYTEVLARGLKLLGIAAPDHM